jgi:hypothetical protein
MTWTILNSVTLTSGSKVVAVSSGLTTNIKVGDALILEDFSLVEIAGVFSGQLELKDNWTDATRTNVKAKVVPTFGDFNDAVEKIRQLTQSTINNYEAMEEWWTQEGSVTFVDYEGNEHTVLTAKEMEKQWLETLATMKPYLPSQNEFASRRAINKAANNNVSGIVNMGKHSIDLSNRPHINQGLWTVTKEASNKLIMGHVNGLGESETDFAMTCIAGVIHKLSQAGTADESRMHFNFDMADDGTRIWDSSGDARGTGSGSLNLLTDTDPKYDNSAQDVHGVGTEAAKAEATSRAFEGGVKNGNFRLGDNGDWSQLYGGWVITQNGALLNSSDYQPLYQDVGLVNGGTYKISVYIEVISGALDCKTTRNGGDVVDNIFLNINESGYYETTVTTTSTHPEIAFYRTSAVGSFEGSITQVSIKPITEEVRINRHDLVAIEYWLAYVDAENPQVYKGGAVQSLATDINGIPTVPSTRPNSYHAYYEGDENTSGREVDFLAIGLADQMRIAGDKTNKIYWDDEFKVRQWRYRGKTFAGAGNGDWDNIDPEHGADLRFSSSVAVLSVQGEADVGKGLISTGFNEQFYEKDSAGVFKAYRQSGNNNSTDRSLSTRAVDGECYLQVLGVVSRLNQGGNDLRFNDRGAAGFTHDGSTGAITWYEYFLSGNSTTRTFLKKPETVLDCFLSSDFGGSKFYGESGNINGIGSGRQDKRYFDAVYSSGLGGMIDLRLYCKPQTSKWEGIKQKYISSLFRGKQKLIFTKAIGSGVAVTNWNISSNTANIDLGSETWSSLGFSQGDKVTLVEDVSGVKRTADVYGEYTLTSIKPSQSDDNLPVGTLISLVASKEVEESVSGKFEAKGVIGAPNDLLRIDDLKDGWYGHWIGMDNKSVHSLNRIALDSTFSAVFKSSIGSNWLTRSHNSSGWNLNTVTNELEVSIPSGYIAMVYYDAYAYQTVLSTNLPIRNDGGGLSKMLYNTSDYRIDHGVLLSESTLGLINKSGDAGNTVQYGSIGLTGEAIVGDSKLSDHSLYQPTHEPVSLGEPTNDSSAAKILFSLVEVNGLEYLQFHANSMSWDDNTFTPLAMTTSMSSLNLDEKYRIDNSSPINGYYICKNKTLTSSSFQTRWDDGSLTQDSDGNVIWNNGTLVLQKVAPDGDWGSDNQVKVLNGTYTDYNDITQQSTIHIGSLPIGYADTTPAIGGSGDIIPA